MKDPTRLRIKVLEEVLAVCKSQLERSEEQLEKIMAMLPLARNPKERTTINIILDDQRKVIKSLRRLEADVSELLANAA